MKQRLMGIICNIDGTIIPSRCRESYIKNNDIELYTYINNHDDNFNFKENLKLIISNDSGYCHCGNIKKIKGNGQFPLTCSPKCSVDVRSIGIQPNKINIPPHELEYLYNIAKFTPSHIGELYDCSNVTVMSRLDEHNIKKRSHSEQQILNHGGCDVWNYNGFDKSILSDIDYLIEQNNTKSINQIASEIGCSPRTIFSVFECNSVPVNKKYKISFPEQILNEYLDELGVGYISSDRITMGNGKELDIYIPSLKVAIEVNGVYWHSENFKDKSYHLEKTKICNSMGITLLHFWDFEVLYKTDIVKSMIKSKLGLIENRIYARKCKLVSISYNEAMNFIDNNHIQGVASSKHNIGLCYNNELVALGTFSKPRFSNKYDHELIRFCNKIDTVVVGGMSKILNSMCGSILSYANIRFSNGNVYDICGFKYVRNTKCGFFYYNSKTDEIISRHKDRRSIEIMHKNNWLRVYDCGNMVFVKE